MEEKGKRNLVPSIFALPQYVRLCDLDESQGYAPDKGHPCSRWSHFPGKAYSNVVYNDRLTRSID